MKRALAEYRVLLLDQRGTGRSSPVGGHLPGDTPEHVFSWMWEDYGALSPHGAAVELLVGHPWPRLYDAERLRHNEVPVAATHLRQRPLCRARVCGDVRYTARFTLVQVLSERDGDGSIPDLPSA